MSIQNMQPPARHESARKQDISRYGVTSGQVVRQCLTMRARAGHGETGCQLWGQVARRNLKKAPEFATSPWISVASSSLMLSEAPASAALSFCAVTIS